MTSKIPIRVEIVETGDALLYLFYPNGTWDDDKLTEVEAERRWPRSHYTWWAYDDE